MEKSEADSLLSSGSREREFEMMNKVFGLQELRETILNYVIHDKKEVLISNARSCRLVSKTWLESTSSILFESHEPLFRFHLREGNPKAPENGQHVHRFLQAAVGHKFLDERVPPYTIKVTGDIFQEEKYQNFFECLVNCGGGLIELDLKFPKKGHFNSLPLTSYSFPKLRLFRVSFHKQDSRADEPPSIDAINKRIEFVQTVLKATGQLKSFRFSYVPWGPYPPNHFGSLKYPPSLNYLDLEYVANDKSLLELSRTSLPQLKTLKLYVTDIPYSDGLITGILQNVRKTLQHFRVEYIPKQDYLGSRRPTTFRLPLMEKLELLWIGTRYLELEDGCGSLQKFTPKLNHLALGKQALSTFKKWAERCCFDTVSSLAISLVSGDYNGNRAHENRNITFDLNTMAALSMGYPNITRLYIGVSATEMPGPVLWEMKKLQQLQLFVFGSRQIRGPNVWDSFLTGIPKEKLANLEWSPDLWNELHDVDNLSIRNLTDLRSLKLASLKPFDDRTDLPLISEVAFDFAFLKMQRLTKLVFEEGFRVTSEVVQKWRKQGRSIETKLYIEDMVWWSDSDDEW